MNRIQIRSIFFLCLVCLAAAPMPVQAAQPQRIRARKFLLGAVGAAVFLFALEAINKQIQRYKQSRRLQNFANVAREGDAAAHDGVESVADLDPSAVDADGNTALMLAAAHGREDMVAALLRQKRFAVDLPNKHGENALLLAAAGGHSGVVAQLLPACDSISEHDQFGNTAFIAAAAGGHRDMVKAMLIRFPYTRTTKRRYRLDVNTRTKNGSTALIEAAYAGHEDIVRMLLACPDIDVNARDGKGLTALMLAAYYGRADVVTALLQHPQIDLTSTDNQGKNVFERPMGNGAVCALLGHLAND